MSCKNKDKTLKDDKNNGSVDRWSACFRKLCFFYFGVSLLCALFVPSLSSTNQV